MKKSKKRVIPGFGLTMGVTITMLSIVVLIPLASLVIYSSQLGFNEFIEVITRKRILSSFYVSFITALGASFVNAVMGLILAWVLVRYEFPGKRIMDGMIELPFALPTAVAGISLTSLTSDQGLIGSFFAKFGIKICELENSKVYLFKEQSHPGRVVVAHKKHVSEILELTPQERAAYLEEIAKVSEEIHKIFKPAKVNYGAYGDTGHHLHFHLVPKYTDEYEWGGTFEMNPGKKFLSDEEYAEMIEKIKAELV